MNRARRMAQRTFALLLTVCMAVLLTACNRSNDSSKSSKGTNQKPAGIAADTDLILPYSREEGLNPFAATSQMNEAIMPLLYDGLYALDEHYKPSAVLAADSVVNGTTVMVTMNSERRFSDGSVITADDVVYSFERARDSAFYGGLLSDIASVTAGGTTTVTFSLKRPNRYIAADLVFPIVKANTADSAKSVPVGSGTYVYRGADQGGILKANDENGESIKAEEIFLLNIPDEETLFDSLNVENVNAAVDDLATGELQRITVPTKPFPLNNLVYVGIRENGNLANASVRQAMNAVLDRKTLISSCLSGYAEASELPLNPAWFGMDGVKVPAAMDRTKARALLEESFRDQTLKLVTLAGNPFHEQITQELVREFASAGVKCEISSLDSSVYRSAVKSGLYDLYVGEFRLTNDMDLSGVLGDKQLESSWEAVQRGASTCAAFVKGFYTQMPILTIGFRTGVMAYSRNVKNEVAPRPGNPYANVSEWELS